MVNDTQDVMTDRDTAYSMISELVARFTDQYDSYKKADYNETLTRRDFIDPFFKALGWDMDNTQGYAESYRKVIHEDKVKIGRATKAPDYAFRMVGGKRLFFVEAKKPSIAIKDESEPAYQIRRYGWSAKLPISIITNFEEFAIYDCTVKPKITDKAATARIKYLSFRDYEKEFDFIWEIFGKERVLKGGLDKFVQSDTHKKGTATVDKEFLKLLDEWRKYLATSIALNNKHLNEEELNFAVQQTIDRIIFLRIAEDRGVEPYGALKNALQGEFYKNLFQIFQEASEKYNSSLFDFTKDTISGKLKIDNKVIKTIVSELYYPESPYEFSVLSVEILGSAYEQFLGKVIRVTPAHHVKIEEKPEVRKAGGVYYTPQYIVEYIVENTVGKLIEGKKPEEISKIKILDPACGSGSFLLGAYQYLLNYHKDYYSEPSRLPKRKKENPLTPDGNLTTAEKKRILTNNIFGVDLDVSAVEVTKLSLLLKCMEGETEASIETQLRLFNERVLPDLDDNIKSGNSLIDTDFYDSHIDFGEEKKIKPFNWQRNFPEVFKQGGFDAVIGNPPYVMLQNLERREIFDYALKKFESSKYKIDTYQIFIEQSVKLLKEHGLVGLITPNTFLKNIHSEPLRKFILNHCGIKEILLFNYSVFSQASVDTCIIIFEKSKSNKQNKLIVKRAEPDFVIHRVAKLKQSQFEKSERYDFNLAISRHDSEILKKISELSKNLGTYCNVYFGIQTFDRKKYVSNIKISEKYEPVIDGENIEPYYLKPATEYLNYIPSAIKSGGKEKVYRQGRICIRQIGATPVATFVPENIFTLNTVYNVYLKEKDINDINFILGIINSNTTKFFWKKNHSDEKKTFPKIKKEAICSIPIPIIDKKNQSRKNDVVNLVQQLLNLNKEKAETKLLSKINVLQEKIEYCESKINKIVYELYGLNEEEIKVIESELEK